MDTLIATRHCAICEGSIPVDVPAVAAEIATYRTRNRRNSADRIDRDVVCTECANLPDRTAVSADGRRSLFWNKYEYSGDAYQRHDCAHCGLPVLLPPVAQRRLHTCSDRCRYAYYADLRRSQRKPETTSTCDGCDAPMNGRSDRRYCSPACRQRAYRSRSAK